MQNNLSNWYFTLILVFKIANDHEAVPTDLPALA